MVTGAVGCVVLAGGYTAGHVFPAIAVAQELARRDPKLELLFVGSKDSVEERVVRGHGYPFEAVPAAPFIRTGARGRARALKVLGEAMRAGRTLLRASGAQAVLGFGGYVTVGTLLSARSLGIPTAIYEGNTVPGLANTFLAAVADRLYLATASGAPSFVRGRAVVTGHPVREEIAAIGRLERRPPDRERAARVLVTGGSLGSAFVNRNAPKVLRRVKERGVALEVWHQTGGASPEDETRAAYVGAGISARVAPFIDDMPSALRWADFAVSRAGAGSIVELCAAGVPALFVPLPEVASDHQTHNARDLMPGVWWVSEREFEPDALAAPIAGVLSEPERFAAISAITRSTSTDGAKRLVDDFLARWPL